MGRTRPVRAVSPFSAGNAHQPTNQGMQRCGKNVGGARLVSAGRRPVQRRKSEAAMDFREVYRNQLTFSANSLLETTQDLTEEEGARRPHGLAPVVWQLGHITYYDARLVSQARGTELMVPASYGQLFAAGTSGEGPFPPLAEVRETFRRVNEEVLKLLELPCELEVPSGPGKSSLAQAVMFTIYHRGWHNGKIMTLRALLGKPIMF